VFRRIICIWVVLSCSVFVQKNLKALKTLKPFKNLKKTSFFVKIQVLPSSPDTNNKVKSERETDFIEIQWQQLRTRGTESAMAV